MAARRRSAGRPDRCGGSRGPTGAADSRVDGVPGRRGRAGAIARPSYSAASMPHAGAAGHSRSPITVAPASSTVSSPVIICTDPINPAPSAGAWRTSAWRHRPGQRRLQRRRMHAAADEGADRCLRGFMWWNTRRCARPMRRSTRTGIILNMRIPSDRIPASTSTIFPFFVISVPAVRDAPLRGETADGACCPGWLVPTARHGIIFGPS